MMTELKCERCGEHEATKNRTIIRLGFPNGGTIEMYLCAECCNALAWWSVKK